MAQVYNRLTVDVRREVTDIVTAVQKDANSRFLDVYLKDNGLPIDLTGHEVRIYGKKYNGTEIYNNGEITEATNGRCQFELTDQALAVAQDLEVQIVIYYNNVQILQSLPFKIKVVKSLISQSSIESSNEYGALVVLYQNLYEAYDLMTTMVQNIGVPGAIAAQLTIDTMWEAWEYLCNYVSEDLTMLIQDALTNNSVDGVIQRLGNTADTGATKTTGSVMGKLNSILNSVNLQKKTHQFVKIVPANTKVPQGEVLLDVTGQGEFYGIYGSKLWKVRIIIDDVEEIINSSPSSTNSKSNWIYPTIDFDLTNLAYESTVPFKAFAPITFRSNLKVINYIDSDTSTVDSKIKIGYALYE